MQAFSPVGYIKSIVHLAPAYASTISMFNSFMAYIAATVIPLLLPLIMPDYTKPQWNHSFYFIAACLTSSTLLYGLFGSAETQPWGTRLAQEDTQKATRF